MSGSSGKGINQRKLKSHSNQSHNQGSQLIALVKCMARLAAEEDFKAGHAHKDNQNIRGNEL